MPQTVEALSFLSRIANIPSGPDAFDALSSALQPSLDDEAALRKLFATDKTNPRLSDPHVGLVDVFDAPADIRTIHARVVKDKTDLSANFILPLSTEHRRQDGTPAMAASLDEFKKNWAVFTEGSLTQLIDWNNVVAAGGSVQACLAPLPDSAKVSKRALRKHFHTDAYPTSDVDLFLYGLTPEQAELKITAIYEAVRDSVPWDVTCVRTKHTVSIHSQYPYRAVQIVLRLYSSPAEILAGFDVDAPCCAYDGQRVWANPRAVVAMMRQCNTVDMTRRSPSYEVRLTKYSCRHFEVYVPSLKRDDVDPTIFERSIVRVQGLARLLVLERIGNAAMREQYLSQRRSLRGRPNAVVDWRRRSKRKYKGDLKSDMDIGGLEMNDYDTQSLHIPYGPGWNARRIEKLVYQTDLGMNSPFNPKNKGRRLHRHPAFFGTMEECLDDCCENCVKPETEEEKQLQAEEDKSYITGRVQFIVEDPGRQSISGSFNPIDVGEWAEQAYITKTEQFFNAIAALDRDLTLRIMQSEDVDINRRDHVGRTPLQVAVNCKATEIACDLIDAGARMTSRLVDGRTVLHLVAQLNLPIVARKLLERSAVNAEKAKEAQAQAEQLKEASATKNSDHGEKMDVDDEDGAEDEDGEDDDEGKNSSEDDWDSDEGEKKSSAENAPGPDGTDGQIPEDADDEPDVFDVNAADWDFALTALQYAVISGSLAVADELISAGADVKLVTKAKTPWARALNALILTILIEDDDTAVAMAKKLFAAGAASSEADDDVLTIFHRVVCSGRSELALGFLQSDPNAKAVVNAPQISKRVDALYPVISSLNANRYSMLAVLLAYGAKLNITEEEYTRARETRQDDRQWTYGDVDYRGKVVTPVEAAISWRDDVVELLLALGAEGSLPTQESIRHQRGHNHRAQYSVLDWVRNAVSNLEKEIKNQTAAALDATIAELQKLSQLPGWKGEFCKAALKCRNIEQAESNIRIGPMQTPTEQDVIVQKLAQSKEYFAKVEDLLKASGAKTWAELFPSDEGKEARPYNQFNGSIYRTTRNLDLQFYRFEYHGSFRSLVPSHQAASYEELFQASFDGDNAKIEQLCLPKGTAASKRDPLLVTVEFGNMMGCTPLFLALHGRHWATARLILAIASAQHKSPTQKAEKFSTKNIKIHDDDDDSDDDDEDEDEDEDMETPEINFIDIAKRSSVVQTEATPAMLLNSSVFLPDATGTKRNFDPPLCHAIVNGDLEAFVQIADLHNILLEPAPLHQMTEQKILAYDRPAFLDEFIRRTGSGVMIVMESQDGSEEVVNIAQQKKHEREYLGLNVHGKKRKDLVQKADSNAVRQDKTFEIPIVWKAARAGALNILEYLASDKPLAAFQHYAATQSDERAKYLRQVSDLSAVWPKWLGWFPNVLGESALTSAVVGDNLDVLKYLVNLQRPYLKDALTRRIKFFGVNNIQIAAEFGCSPEMFDYLLDHGVSYNDVDARGWNIYHILCANNKVRHQRLLAHVLERLPQDISESMLTRQRKGDMNTDKRIDTVRHLMKIKSLPFLVRNAVGLTPLHIAVKGGYAQITQILVDAGPHEALHMEDGVGNTPLEIATQRSLLKRTTDAFPSSVTAPPMLIEHYGVFPNTAPFDLDRLEGEILKLRHTIQVLTRDGKLRTGTKLANELAIFSQKMEARLAAAKTTRDRAKVDADKKNDSETDTDKLDNLCTLDWGEAVEKTLQIIKTAVSAHPGLRRLVHLHDVHESVRASLAKLVDRQVRQMTDQDDDFEPEAKEDGISKQSALAHWSVAFGAFPRDEEDSTDNAK